MTLNTEIPAGKEHLRRVRMLYSLGDFQQALSAYDFLLECDLDKTYSVAELRRFRCYETNMIVSYARPFLTSKGDMPKLSMKMIGADLSVADRELHDALLQRRHKVVAHSDEEFMRMAVEPFTMEMPDGDPLHVFIPTFDEGMEFIGMGLYPVGDLIRKLMQSLMNTLWEQAQEDPERVRVLLNVQEQNTSK